MKPRLPPLSRFGRLTLLLCSCQAKTRMTTWRLLCMHTPFYFQIPKNFTRFPGSYPSKVQHGQEVGRKKRTKINFLKPALLFKGWSSSGLQEHLEVPEKKSEVTFNGGKAHQQIHVLSGFWLVGPWKAVPCPFQGLLEQIFALTLIN